MNMILWKDAAFINFVSQVYNHYDTTLQCSVDETLGNRSLSFVFTCKDHPELHSGGPIVWARKKGGTDGTSNLQKAADSCLWKQGIDCQKNAFADAIPYSESGHRVLNALRCAKQSRPANSVLDEDYQWEVEMLCPGTKLPHPTTVQQDLIHIYEHASTWVMNYFLVLFINHSALNYELILYYLKALNSVIHLVLDGWTAPLVASYLGLVVVWHDNGIIYWTVLEFIWYDFQSLFYSMLIFFSLWKTAWLMHMMVSIWLKSLPTVSNDFNLTNL